ncbi:uracil-DNA glycosylase family protein [Pararhizobium mangrovi]|uniref:Uracil-DNA glycosylase family protein n=1 Tax=Pararhizobium mangrovi TaxID=2590452 RepID=A0A506UAM4_9HYPH|nr:uracil-DNA glycosylase family protein [Pararhizobium mangrovi]TPW29639.1 uracil-DNA glycosylase family protein [Pararhizobium mangrovi]
MSAGDAVAAGELARRVRACRICRDAPAPGRPPLPHEPRPVCRPSASARLLVAGQAPGRRVHETGLPFNDASGDRLRTWLGIDRETFYDPARIAIVPMAFCFPGNDAKGGDLPPRRECVATWHDDLMATMGQIELVLAIGAYAQRYHLGRRCRASLTETVASWRETVVEDVSPRVLPLPHPSWRNTGWLKRNPWFEADVLPFLRSEVARLVR